MKMPSQDTLTFAGHGNHIEEFLYEVSVERTGAILGILQLRLMYYRYR